MRERVVDKLCGQKIKTNESGWLTKYSAFNDSSLPEKAKKARRSIALSL
jgi:hypothetical protein